MKAAEEVVQKLFLMLLSYPEIEVLTKETNEQVTYVAQKTSEMSAFKLCTEKLRKLKATSVSNRNPKRRELYSFSEKKVETNKILKKNTKHRRVKHHHNWN